jgi:hypothetical protein
VVPAPTLRAASSLTRFRWRPSRKVPVGVKELFTPADPYLAFNPFELSAGVLKTPMFIGATTEYPDPCAVTEPAVGVVCVGVAPVVVPVAVPSMLLSFGSVKTGTEHYKY